MKVIFLSYFIVILGVSLLHAEGKKLQIRAFGNDNGGSHVTNVSTEDNGGCTCGGEMCGCCQQIKFDIPFVKFDHVFCANVSYSEEDLNVRLTLSIDGNVFIDEELSARNPPPICAGIPGLEEYGSVCIDLYNMDYTKSSLSGCIKLEISVLTIKALDVKFGCFKIPLQKRKIKDNRIGKKMELPSGPHVHVATAPRNRQNYSEMTKGEKVEFIQRLGLLKVTKATKANNGPQNTIVGYN